MEAISGRPWESARKSCLVFIGTDKSELEAIVAQLSESVDHQMDILSNNSICKEHAKIFSMKIAADGRFKVIGLFMVIPQNCCSRVLLLFYMFSVLLEF